MDMAQATGDGVTRGKSDDHVTLQVYLCLMPLPNMYKHLEGPEMMR